MKDKHPMNTLIGKFKRDERKIIREGGRLVRLLFSRYGLAVGGLYRVAAKVHSYEDRKGRVHRAAYLLDGRGVEFFDTESFSEDIVKNPSTYVATCAVDDLSDSMAMVESNKIVSWKNGTYVGYANTWPELRAVLYVLSAREG